MSVCAHAYDRLAVKHAGIVGMHMILMDRGCVFRDVMCAMSVLDAFASHDGVWRRGPVPGARVAYRARGT